MSHNVAVDGSTDPNPVVATFKTGDEPKFQVPENAPFDETSASVAHSSTSCDSCEKTGLVRTDILDVVNGLTDGLERDLICEDCDEKRR